MATSVSQVVGHEVLVDGMEKGAGSRSWKSYSMKPRGSHLLPENWAPVEEFVLN